MIDLTRAFSVVERSIRRTAGLNPPSAFPFTIQDTLKRLGMDDEGSIETLKGNIVDGDDIGLPSLVPPFKMNEELLTIDETSTVGDVVFLVHQNAVPDAPQKPTP